MAAQAQAILVLLIGAYGTTVTCADQCGNGTALSARLDALLAEYPRDQPPGGEGPLLVSVGLHLRHASIDEVTSRVHLIADLALGWTDSRLWWNISEWDCGEILVEAERLWLPDIELISTGSSDAGGRLLRAKLAAGAVHWVRRLDVRMPVPLTLEYWPNDVQHAVFKFASRQYTVQELDLAPENAKYPMVIFSGSWKATALRPLGLSVIQDVEGSSRRVAAWEVELQRHAAAEGAAATAALAAAGLMMIAAAIQPPAHRMVLAAGASLTAAIWLASISPLLARASSPPRLATAACACCVLGALQAAWSALLSRLARCSRTPSHKMRRVMATAAGLCCLTLIDEEPSSGCTAWRALAALLDRVSLLIAVSAFIMIVIYLASV